MPFARDVRALVLKDIWLSRKHKVTTVLEILFPLLLAYGAYNILHIPSDDWHQPPAPLRYFDSRGDVEAFVSPPFLTTTAASAWFTKQPDPKDGIWFTPNGMQAAANGSAAMAQMAHNASATPQLPWAVVDFLSVSTTAVSTTSGNGISGDAQVNVSLVQGGLFGRSVQPGGQSSVELRGDSTSGASASGAPFEISELLWRLYNPQPSGVWQPRVHIVCPDSCTTNNRQVRASAAVILFPIGLLPTVTVVAGRLTEEAVGGVRDHLFTLGVSRAGYIAAHFVTALLRIIPFTLLVLSVIPLAGVEISFGNAALAYVATVVYVLCLLGISAVCPSIFKRPALAMVLVFTLGMMVTGGGPYATVVPPALVVAMAIVLPPIAFSCAAGYAVGNGIVQLPVSPAAALGLLALQTIGYTLLIQGLQHRSSLADLLPFLRLRLRHGRDAASADDLLTPIVNAEQRQSGGDVVRVRGLCKTYGDTQVVVDVDLTVRRGEILSLIGPNGAGKSTTIAMLTGVTAPTAAKELLVDGCDVRTDVEGARRGMAVCPQHDVLFGDLTATQHLRFVAMLKATGTTRRIDELLTALSLPTDKKTASEFSGGMKRRLSVACSLVSGAPLVLLDEPTSGLDPHSRRELWDLLLAEKERGTALLLTTHFMEEAELLGDRIAIIAKGRLICCDTATVLKRTYGAGFFVTFSKTVAAGQRFDSEGMLRVLQARCPGAKFERESLGSAVYLLPANALPVFGDVFELVERSMAALGATAYGVALASLEDIFVAIAEDRAMQEDGSPPPITSEPAQQPFNAEAVFNAACAENRLVRNFAVQTTAMVIVRLRRMRGSCWAWLLQVLVPVAIVALGLSIAGLFASAGPDIDHSLSPAASSGLLRGNATAPLLTGFDPLQLRLLVSGEIDSQSVLATLATAAQLYGTMAPRYFPELAAAMSRQPPTLSYQFLTTAVLQSGAWLGGSTLMPTPPFETLSYPTLVLTASTNQTSGTTQFVYSSSFLVGADYRAFVLVDHLLRLAADPAAAVAPNVTMNLQRTLNVNSSAPMPTSPIALHSTAGGLTDAGGSTSSRHNSKLDEESAAIVFSVVIAAALATSNAGLGIVDDLNRGVFDVLRIHGLGSGAFWLAAYTVGLLPYPLIFATAEIGAGILGVSPLYRPASLLGGWSLFFYATSACLLLAFVVPTVLPGRSHVTYFSLTMLIGLVQLLPLQAGISNERLLCVPLGVYLHGALSLAGVVSSANAAPWYLMALSLIGWNVLPVVILALFSAGVLAKQRNVLPARTFEDDDVTAERERVLRDGATDVAQVVGLRHTYNGTAMAVDGVTFGLRPGECFGLLGPNGAGKTTTIKALLKDIVHPSEGHVAFRGVPAGLRREEVYRRARLGVCAQHDTLWPELTARQHLQVYLHIRLGSHFVASEWVAYIESALVVAELGGPDADRPVGQFSGGMKRKLATAIAANTGARVAVLDEPSTGMDPRARRALWRSIGNILRQPDRCVLLTTHSMEEADAVCARIAIAIGGRLGCIGNATYLKSRFGTGYRILLQRDTAGKEADKSVAPIDTAGIAAAMQQLFGRQCELVENAGATLRFTSPTLPMSVAHAFRAIGQRQKELGISFFCVECASLEDVFLKLTQQ